MCELLGISCSPAARMELWFDAFRRRAAENVSGWGVSWFDDAGRPHVVKEPLRADHSELAERMADEHPCSRTFIVHVRAATVGRISHENTHPFEAEVCGRPWVFAHNGTIKDLDDLDAGGRTPLGETDSEAAFLRFQHVLEQLGPQPADADLEDAVWRMGRTFSERGKCNFLLSDGRTLFAYYDGHKTLHHTTGSIAAMPPLHDADYRIDLQPELPEEGSRSVVIASVPLSEGPWERLEPGSMLVCRNGSVVAAHQDTARR